LNPTSPTDPGSDTAASAYSFASTWAVPASRERLWRTFDDLLVSDDPFVFWPGMNSRRQADGSIQVVAGSPVGYKLRFRLHDMVDTPMETVTLRSDGDLDGRATMRFHPGDETNCLLDVTWHVRVTPLWMRVGERVLRPVYVRAHDLVMRRGERGLAAWLRANPDTGSERSG
jgi:hypothetical protein